SYASQNFKPGDLVRVCPGKHVFIYDGYDRESPDRIWLKTLNDDGRRQVPSMDIICRLEKVKNTRPVGRLNTPILSPEKPILDQLLGTSYFNNYSHVRNELLLLDAIGEYHNFVDTCIVTSSEIDISDRNSVRDILPSGYLVPKVQNNEQWFKCVDPIQSTGQPLYAVTHSADLLADYCIDAPLKSKLVVVNGLSRFQNNLQAYDDISQTQRLIIFADHADQDQVIELFDRGCRIWLSDSAELSPRKQSDFNNVLFGDVLRSAHNFDNLLIEYELCDDPLLSRICSGLNHIKRSERHQNDSPIGRVITQAWHLFRFAYDRWDPPRTNEQEHLQARIHRFTQELKLNQTWFTREEQQSLDEIAELLISCFSYGSEVGRAKGVMLLKLLAQTEDESKSVAVITRDAVSA
ncbi:MAG: hypothetical protein ACREHG_08665, partial [Candidatus Saccharimonadales bacterium]